MKINEVTETRQKAGVIPFYVKDGKIMMLFMIPSDPAYGGSAPQIAKGGVDAGESVQQAAIREGSEELGLDPANIVTAFQAHTSVISGMDESYRMTIFAAQVKDPKAFSAGHYETGKKLWLTLEKFASTGRKSQLAFVQAAHQKIQSQLPDEGS